MPEFKKGYPMPQERRYGVAPASGEGEIVDMPRKLRKEANAQGIPEELFVRSAVEEFSKSAGCKEGEVITSPFLFEAAERYIQRLAHRREIKKQIESIKRAIKEQKETGVLGLASIFTKGIDLEGQLVNLGAELEHLEELIAATKDTARAANRLIKEPGSVAWQEVLRSKTVDPKRGWEILFALARRRDAFRKFSVYMAEVESRKSLETRTDIFADVLRLRELAENVQSSESAGAESGKKDQDKKMPIEKIIVTYFGPVLDRLIDRIIDARIVSRPEGMSEKDFRNKIREHLLERDLQLTAQTLRKELLSKQDEIVEKRQAEIDTLNNPRNADLAELVQRAEVDRLIHLYHVEKRRFLPVREIGEEIDHLDRIITSKSGPILRVLLYGPPGTGKTESLREVGARHGQRVRVISLHETSTFETLVGMHQIPLPKAETLADAERFWSLIGDRRGADLLKQIPEAILEQFTGDTLEEKADDFRRWFEAKLKVARAAAAIGAVGSDDPRVREVEQKALAAWLDQPLSVGLQSGDLIVLDEMDRAGSALEGLQDILTRRPGEVYQPAGRPDPFVIHPDARVCGTANWGDLLTERTSGGGRLSAPILSRVIDIRKFGYASAETERYLFAIMTSGLDGKTLFGVQERPMVVDFISKVIPKLREYYLRPTDLQLVTTPISIRTLENIARRLIDETTHTRIRDKEGQPVHFIEAAWAEATKGPFPEDQAEAIKLTLARIFSDSGVFNYLPDTIELPKYLLVAKLTGISPDKIKSFIGVLYSDSVKELPKDLSFGQFIDSAWFDDEDVLRPPHVYKSPLAMRRDEEVARRRAMEEEGANFEVQEELDKVVDRWKKMRADLDPDVAKNFEAVLELDIKFLKAQIDEIADKFGRGDARVFLSRIGELFVGSSELRKRSGLLISLILNRSIREMGDNGNNFSETLDLTDEPDLDFIGFEFPKGMLAVIGITGDYTAMFQSGGVLTVEGNGIIKGHAGNKFAFGMRGGEASVEVCRTRACQKMEDGRVVIKESAGDRLGLDASGGDIEVLHAGDRCGLRSNAKIKVSVCGLRLGEELGPDGFIDLSSTSRMTIQLAQQMAAERLGSRIKGTVKIGGVTVVEKGVKKI